MKLTKEQKIYAGVLGVALAGLTIDRVILESEHTSPSQASAQSLTDSAFTGRDAPVPQFTDTKIQLHQPFISHRLTTVAATKRASLGRTVDMFSPSDVWFAKPEPEVAPVAPTRIATADPRLKIEAFETQHKLNAVMTKDGAGYALIDNQMLRVGQAIDGFKLVSIDKQSATFEARDGMRAELSLNPGAE